MIPLPAYIDKDAWQGFCDMRKAIKKPLTHRAAVLVLYELQRIKDAGHDANAALDQSTNHCWADVYVPKVKEIEKAASAQKTAADETAEYLKQQREHAAKVEAQRALRRMAHN